MDRPTCTETWQTAATRAVSEGLANNGAHVLFVTIDATPMSGGAWCPSWLDIYWSDGAHISLEGFC